MLSVINKAQAIKGLEVGQTVISAIILDTDPKNVCEDMGAWKEMHSVAHLWAALLDLIPAEMPDSAISDNPFAWVSKDDLPAFLRQAEKLLDLMEARPDLRHPDPWRCNDEVRVALELEPRGALKR